MLFDVYRIFDQPTAKVDTVLGRPSEAKDGPFNIHYRKYQKRGYRVEAQFQKGKSIYFGVYLDRPAPSAEIALSLVGVDVRGRKPHSQTQFRKAWRGKFKNPAIKEVASLNTSGKGWGEIGISNELD